MVRLFIIDNQHEHAKQQAWLYRLTDLLDELLLVMIVHHQTQMLNTQAGSDMIWGENEVRFGGPNLPSSVHDLCEK